MVDIQSPPEEQVLVVDRQVKTAKPQVLVAMADHNLLQVLVVAVVAELVLLAQAEMVVAAQWVQLLLQVALDLVLVVAATIMQMMLVLAAVVAANIVTGKQIGRAHV